MRADSRLGVEEDHRVSGEGRVGRCLDAAATSGAGPTPTCWDKKRRARVWKLAHPPLRRSQDRDWERGLEVLPRAGPELQELGGEPGLKFPGVGVRVLPRRRLIHFDPAPAGTGAASEALRIDSSRRAF